MKHFFTDSMNNLVLTTVKGLHKHLDSITKYLLPILPLANCHMVEFLTENHWDNLLPSKLRVSLDNIEFGAAIQSFWNINSGHNGLFINIFYFLLFTHCTNTNHI